MKKFLFTTISVVLLSTCVTAQKLWNQKADFPGAVRNNGIGFALNGKGYIGLGQSASPSTTKYSDMYEYDPSTNKWIQKANYPGAGTAASTVFVANGKGYVGLGVNSSGAIQKDLWEYTPSTNTWTQKANFPGTARNSPGCFVINDTAFFIAGTPGGTPYLSDVWMYIPATNTWTQKANFAGGSRAGAVGISINGIGYFGTGITSGTSAKKDMWMYNKPKDTWSSIADFGGAAITGAIGFDIDKKGYLGTGNNLTNYTKDIYEYDPTANTWTKLDSIPSSQSVRGSSVAFVINRIAYFGTGYGTSATTSLNDFWSYTPKTICNSQIISDPKSLSVNIDNNAKFSITAVDTTVSFKWQVNTGSGYSDVSNGGQYSGAKTKQLAIIGVKFSSNNNKFRCIVGVSTCADTSSDATLNVLCLPIIKTEPSSVSSGNGNEAKFFTSSFYTSAVLQWQKNDGSGFQNLSNAGQFFGYDMDTLHVFNLSITNNNYKFRCIANYGGCFDTSNTANLAVYCKPIIKSQPINRTVYNGSNMKFGGSAYDFGTTFQWQTKVGSVFQNTTEGGQYTGSNTDSLSISPVNITNRKQEYRCIMAFKSCSDTSKIVTLDVLCNPIINKNPMNTTGVEGSKIKFYTSSLFPSTTTYSWQTDIGLGFQKLNDAGQYSGTNKDTLFVANLLFANDNQKFRCIHSSAGCFDTSKSVSLSVVCKALIETHPINKTAIISNNAFLHVVANDPKATFAWQSDIGFGFQNLSNAGQFSGVNNDTITISNLTPANNNQIFRCLLTLANCKDTSETAKLTVKTISINPLNAKDYFKIYPNPVSNLLNIETRETANAITFLLYNINGQLLIEQKIIGNKAQLNLSNINRGIYYLKCITGNGFEIIKILKN